MAEELENTQEQPTDTPTVETEETTTVDTTQSEEETQEQPTDSASDEEVVKTTKKKSKTIGYTAAYIGKGGHAQVLPGSFKRKKDAERKLRESGVDPVNFRVQPIKE